MEGRTAEEALARFLVEAREPAAEFGMMPFWFWNDDLDEGELIRQLRAFHGAGMGGVVLHPRVGLGRAVGYLTPEYFRLVRRVVDECAALGMKVVLYDEGSYPSGSACGRVVAENPDHAARALTLVRREVAGPFRGYWRPAAGRSLQQRLVSTVVARAELGAVDPATLRVLEPLERGLVRLDLGPGDWWAMACVDVPSGGTIRGVFPEHDDGAATAPAAADLMNPEAVAAFLRLTHDAYAEHLEGHLGTTVVAMFTDEPNPLGRGARREARPFTAGFEAWLAADPARAGGRDVRAWLPALWVDYGPGTEEFRRAYASGIHERVREVFYGAQAAWCASHGIALTGHPADSDDMATLADFHWPGQDMVWRWVVPDGDSGLVGAHSTAPKAATSAARAGGRRRAVTELFGAYGWRLSLDEAKWLIDWHLARGVNLFLPHACFYSLRGGRAYESEPDIGLHNPWWAHFPQLARYTRRMSWLLTDCEHVCDTAVLGDGRRLPWEAARRLYERQIDFLYIDGAALYGASVEGGRLRVGDQAYRTVVLDGPPPPPAGRPLERFRAAGGRVLAAEPLADLAERVRAAVPPDVAIEPPCPDLRVLHVRRRGVDVYALFNEGPEALAGALTVAAPDAERGGRTGGLRAEWWDPLRGTRCRADVAPWRAGDGQGVWGGTAADAGGAPGWRVRFVLDRRETRLLLAVPDAGEGAAGSGEGPRGTPEAGIRPGRSEKAGPAPGPRTRGPATILAVPGPWAVTGQDGLPAAVRGPGDWTAVPGMDLFSGTLTYAAMLRLPFRPSRAVLDLGAVGEAAEVLVDDRPAGSALWAPHRVELPPALLRAGEQRILVRVTNSAANAFDGATRPSGLMGPVSVALWPPAGEEGSAAP